MQQYRGCTTRPLYKRFDEHLTSIRDPATTCSVGLHWKRPGHKIGHPKFLGVEKLGNRNRAVLRERERDKLNETGVLAAGINRNL